MTDDDLRRCADIVANDPGTCDAITLSAIARLEEAAQAAPWLPDIDKTDSGEEWTGKFYVGEDHTPEQGTWCTYNDEPHTIPNVLLVQAMRSIVGPMRREIERLRAQVATAHAEGVAEARAEALAAMARPREDWGG